VGLMSIAGSMGGDIISSAASMHEARKNRRWQEKMSSTAHQREVKDLIAAGLNPVLSAGGKGAGIGPGAMGNIADLGRAFTSARSVDIAKSGMKANVRKANAEAAGVEVDSKFKQEMYNFFRGNKDIKESVLMSLLFKQAGVPPWWGGITGLMGDTYNSARSAARRWRNMGKAKRIDINPPTKPLKPRWPNE